MPFKSEKQRRFMWAEHPEIAKRWAHEYPKSNKGLPMYADKNDSAESKEKQAALGALGSAIAQLSGKDAVLAGYANTPVFSKKSVDILKRVDIPHSEVPTYAGEEREKGEQKLEKTEDNEGAQSDCEESDEDGARKLLAKISAVLARPYREELETNQAEAEGREPRFVPQNMGLKRYSIPSPYVTPPMGSVAAPPNASATQGAQSAQQNLPQPGNAPVGGGSNPQHNPIQAFGPLGAKGQLNGNAAFGQKNSPDSLKTAGITSILGGGDKPAEKQPAWYGPEGLVEVNGGGFRLGHTHGLDVVDQKPGWLRRIFDRDPYVMREDVPKIKKRLKAIRGMHVMEQPYKLEFSHMGQLKPEMRQLIEAAISKNASVGTAALETAKRVLPNISNTVLQRAGIGAGVGAVGGGAIGAMRAKPGERLRGAATGAGVGAGLGAGTGAASALLAPYLQRQVAQVRPNLPPPASGNALTYTPKPKPGPSTGGAAARGPRPRPKPPTPPPVPPAVPPASPAPAGPAPAKPSAVAAPQAAARPAAKSFTGAELDQMMAQSGFDPAKTAPLPRQAAQQAVKAAPAGKTRVPRWRADKDPLLEAIGRTGLKPDDVGLRHLDQMGAIEARARRYGAALNSGNLAANDPRRLEVNKWFDKLREVSQQPQNLGGDYQGWFQKVHDMRLKQSGASSVLSLLTDIDFSGLPDPSDLDLDEDYDRSKSAAAKPCSCGCGDTVTTCKCGPSCKCRQPGGSCYKGEKAAQLGLWDRINAKRKRGEKPAKPGDKDYPDSKSWNKVTAISEKQSGSTPAWQRAAGKNPEGGLNAKGRASYKRETGGTLKAPVTEKNPSGERAKRQNSFCSRMCGMKRVNTGAKTKSDPDSRINKALRKWNCKCGSAADLAVLAGVAKEAGALQNVSRGVMKRVYPAVAALGTLGSGAGHVAKEVIKHPIDAAQYAGTLAMPVATAVGGTYAVGQGVYSAHKRLFDAMQRMAGH